MFPIANGVISLMYSDLTLCTPIVKKTSVEASQVERTCQETEMFVPLVACS